MSHSTSSGIRVAVSTTLLVLVAALLASAAYALQLRCEGFACTGVGILWLAWAVVYFVVVTLCLAVRKTLPAGSVSRRLVSLGTLGLLILGLVLLGYWQFRNAAA